MVKNFLGNLSVSWAKTLGLIALVKPMVEKLNIKEIVDRICPIREIADISHGTIVEMLICNRLSSPTPLYDLVSWATKHAVEESYKVNAEKLNDDRIARTLDNIYPQISTLQGEIAIQAIEKFGLDCSSFHYDISSIRFSGEYENEEEDLLKITFGYSRDRRPDQKQVNLGLNVTNDGGVPLLHVTLDGNTADVTTVVDNMEALKKIVKRDHFIIVGDRGLVSQENLLSTIKAGLFFVVSVTFDEGYKKLFQEKLKQQEWNKLDYVSSEEAKKPQEKRSIYYGKEIDTLLHDKEGQKDYPIRLLFIKSTAKRKRDKKNRRKNMKKINNGLKRIQSLLNKYQYKTTEYVWGQIHELFYRNPSAKFFKVEVKEKKEGRKKTLVLNYSLDREKLREQIKFDGIYLLATNIKKKEHNSSQVLAIYKSRFKAESRFKDIKGPIKIRPIFLHKPERIESLVFVIVLSLMVYSLLERQCRQSGRENMEKITGRKIMEIFKTLSVIKLDLKTDAGIHSMIQTTSLTPEQKMILNLLKFPHPSTYISHIH